MFQGRPVFSKILITLESYFYRKWLGVWFRDTEPPNTRKALSLNPEPKKKSLKGSGYLRLFVWRGCDLSLLSGSASVTGCPCLVQITSHRYSEVPWRARRRSRWVRLGLSSGSSASLTDKWPHWKEAIHMASVWIEGMYSPPARQTSVPVLVRSHTTLLCVWTSCSSVRQISLAQFYSWDTRSHSPHTRSLVQQLIQGILRFSHALPFLVQHPGQLCLLLRLTVFW